MVGIVAIAGMVGCGGSSSPAAPAAASVSMSVASVTFPSFVAGTATSSTVTSQNITLSNSGGTALTISGITITGTNASSFSQTNTCGATVAASASCTITVNFTATTAGNYSATLVIANSASTGGSVSIPLSGTVTAQTPVASLSAATLTFPSMLTTATATAQTVTLTNSGTGSLTISGITIAGTNPSNFSQSNTCGTLPATLAVGANCKLTVSFAATSAGSYSATLAIANNSSTPSATVALSGTTTAPPGPTATLDQTTLTFPSMVAGATATAQTVKLTNNGGTALTISGITITGTNASNFSESTTCGATLAIGASCSVTVNFAAASAGSYSATLSIANNSATNPATVALSGTTTAPTPVASLSVTTLTFPSMVAGATATAQSVTLTNTGNGSLTISGITITGSNASNFTETTSCGATLPISASCTTTVNFAATTAGSFSASLNIANNSSANPVTVALSGTTTAPSVPLASLSPSPVTFASTIAGATNTQAVTLSNSGGAALTISGIALSGTGANLFSETTTCGTLPATLAAGSTCTINLTFAPKVAGTYAATLTVTDNANSTAGSTQTATLTGTATAFTIAVNTTSTCAWTIDNGAITYNWNSVSGNLVSWILDGYSDQLVDTTTTSKASGCSSQPQGLYFESASTGTFATTTPTVSCTYVGATVTGTTSCTQGSGTTPYFDWALTYPSNGSTSTYTFTDHWLVFPNDPGVHIYTQLSHATTDAAASVGQMQYVFRDSQTILNHTYEVNEGLGMLGITDIPLPALADTSSSDLGRTSSTPGLMQNAVEDLHGFSDIPGTFGRYFETKYDYAGYEYLHKAHGTYGTASTSSGGSGTTYGVWSVFPRLETLVGGPTKQNLWFTGNLVMVEAYSDHEDEALDSLGISTAANVKYNRFFGPFYYHVNVLGQAYNQTGNTLATTADMYADAVSAGAAFLSANTYDNVAPLVAAGYTPSTGRGTVTVQMTGVTGSQYTAWAVLSDSAKNFQISSSGMQYWADISNSGSATFTGVVPGTYRLSVYVLGQWGEYRTDGIVVAANQTTTVPTAAFVPENFGSTVFTIGVPDRSAHEFLHGHFATTVNSHMVAGNDDREYWGNWNYWADFAANNGAVIYYATPVGSNAASDYTTQWNYNHWGSSFNPTLFDPTNDTADGYSNTANVYGNGIPTYVGSLSGATGTNGVTTGIPAWQVYFATPASALTTYSSEYVDLSIAVACTEGSYVVNLNGKKQLTWSMTNKSDCMVRSGLSGYTQWFVMEWPVSDLTQTVGGSNEITIGMSQVDGSSDDALRLELTNTSANPATRLWYDYTFDNGTITSNNDTVPNP